MEAIKRNILYWGRVLEKTAFSLLLGVAAYILMMTFLEGEWNPGRLFVKIMGFCVLFMCISTFVTAFQALNVYFPLTISMGSTRKASFTGMQIVLHVIMAQWCVLGAGVCCFLEDEVKAVLSYIAVGIIGSGVLLVMLANLMCVFAARFGKNVGVIVYIIWLVGAVAGAVYLIASGIMDNGINLEWLSQPFLLFIGILADAIVIFVYYKEILKYNY